MRHVFRVTKLGWEKEKKAIWFDSSLYTKEEALACFKPYEGITQRGYPYTGYEFAGEKYHDIIYLGEYPDDGMPENDNDYLDHLMQEFIRTNNT